MSSMYCLLLFSSLAILISSMPPPEGILMKPAKDITDSEDKFPSELSSHPPPNLKLRSRMMAALNADELPKTKSSIGSLPIILTKNRKVNKSTTRSFFGIVTAAPSSSPPRPHHLRPVPTSSHYAVNPMLQTNFVDSEGRVLQNVVSVPIRVGPEVKKKIVSSSTLEEPERVEVKFGQQPLSGLL